VKNFAEDADDDFFSRVLHNENHVLQPLLPPLKTMVMNCDADAMNVGYSYVQRCQTQFIYSQLHKYRPRY